MYNCYSPASIVLDFTGKFFSSTLGAGYPLVWYILKQLFTSVSAKSGGCLPRHFAAWLTATNIHLHFKGPLQYLVAMICGCHARAILLPVGLKFFACFLASWRRPVRSSRRQLFFISLRQTQKKLFCLLNF